ncbi:ATPase WRNIP1 [Selaginella moellendorffii]|uniref:ATPase WRNIP1 n=1 Tax=Selaginella moellendorffii TaxID=88036 RepID=UPI000D1CDB93|nr:ATPase WRNIP1 [Selaginella moellendorffii]|eukprot:XP_024514855.1 ATPase WRNIP1 [Selaginella moellendorffii]
MDYLTDMGFSRELAAQALAATGGKSTYKATEWILNQRKSDGIVGAGNAGVATTTPSRQQHQGRVDQFFAASTSKALVAITDGENGGKEAPSQKKIVTRKNSFFKSKDDEATTTTRTVLTITDRVFESADADVGGGVAKVQKQPALVEPPAKKLKQDEEQQPSPPPPQQKSFPFLSTKVAKKNSKAAVPLAERMRPTSVNDILGQDHLLGPRGILKSLLEGDSLASVIFWGPPGTGKTTLARAIASTVSYRFVALSAVTSGVKEVREVLEEAKKAKKYGQRTLLFLDEVHRFNKAQQDAFLPYVEAGHVVFVGATTENPSFEINAALLSRCKVLTMNKLLPEHLEKLIKRAVLDKEKGVIVSAGISSPEMLRVEDDAVVFLAAAADGDARAALNTLEIAVLAASSRFQSGEAALESVLPAAKMDNTPSPSRRDAATGNAAPGEWDNRTGTLRKEPSGVEKIMKRDSFNILEVLKENVQHSQQEYTKPFKKFVGGKNVTAAAGVAFVASAATVIEADKEADGTSMDREVLDRRVATLETEIDKSVMVVTLADVKDALQRSHVFYDKTGEEHYNIISALHKSMRGGDADASIYWLARMLEGGEGPLYVARRLVRFASEDVGLADPQALPQAIACYQACHFLGMPECNVHLAQCVVYLALAPKSVAVYQAIQAAQQYVREKGQNEPVPLHLRNAPTKLMKDLGYAKGYIYPPSHSGPVEQDYMPSSLRGLKFLRWPPT